MKAKESWEDKYPLIFIIHAFNKHLLRSDSMPGLELSGIQNYKIRPRPFLQSRNLSLWVCVHTRVYVSVPAYEQGAKGACMTGHRFIVIPPVHGDQKRTRDF